MLTRRGLITGLVSLVAAPAVVRASSLMPVKAWQAPELFPFRGDIGRYGYAMFQRPLSDEEIAEVRAYFAGIQGRTLPPLQDGDPVGCVMDLSATGGPELVASDILYRPIYRVGDGVVPHIEVQVVPKALRS